MTVVSLDVGRIQAAVAAAGRVTARLASETPADVGAAGGSALAPMTRDIAALLGAERDAGTAVAATVRLMERHLHATQGAGLGAGRYTP